MLSRNERLNTAAFKDVLTKGRVIHSPLFLLRILSGQNGVRISAVAPQKIAKTAVERNRTRRLIYNGVRPLLPQIVPGTYVIIFTKQPLNLEVKAVTDDLSAVFAKTGLMK